VRVPPGTEVIALTRIGATGREMFPSPMCFQPDRWLGDGVSRDSTRRSMFPFGGGPRYCPGRYLALLEMKMVMSMLARTFDRPEVRTQTGREPTEIFNFTMTPDPLAMRLQPRAAGSREPA
jgi:cytochrome P450